ncbi:DUF2218 domain-containing protein [Notoacmeibacter ruber]|uniref:DUF2218 domain-containing protein n=1 Tax=Notoacmeibacter ruber TaxID=2670375 RepID=A0A3L7J901_9HYPH|nr:DUF2218 domain-containing protein [Notoacmeibacter ruber]RLQ86845.1 DUF2218 domain-containing protein [Notoacmeibacter ruber]
MPSTTANVSTPKASRYMQQLCKHFAHKVPVTFDTETASVNFPFGDCRMWADETSLRIECSSADNPALQRTRAVVQEHFERFAWREEPAFNWSPAC